MKLLQKKYVDNPELELTEKVIRINRVAKVVKGGRRFSFNALSVVGDNDGHIGIGFGKANEVPDAIRKSVESAKKNVVKIERKKNTIPHEVVGKYKTSRVILRPAYPGTGVKAGDAVRSIIELAGISDILTKVHGSRNDLNVVKATFLGLCQLRNHFEVAKMRDISIYKLWGQPYKPKPAKVENESEGTTNDSVEKAANESTKQEEAVVTSDSNVTEKNETSASDAQQSETKEGEGQES